MKRKCPKCDEEVRYTDLLFLYDKEKGTLYCRTCHNDLVVISKYRGIAIFGLPLGILVSVFIREVLNDRVVLLFVIPIVFLIVIYLLFYYLVPFRE